MEKILEKLEKLKKLAAPKSKLSTKNEQAAAAAE
jgi:hypothetical protein